MEIAEHYNYFRDYDPGIGRYVQSDPIGLKGGFSTFGYSGSNPLRFRDPRGLLVINGNCTGGNRKALDDAERDIRKKVEASCGGCADRNTGCIPCKYWQALQNALNTSVVSCSDTDNASGDCALGEVNGKNVTMLPKGMQPGCGCLKATLLHELLHNVGMGGGDHPEINHIEKRCFSGDCGPLDRGYGPFTPPSDPFY